jgi:phosphate regulon transcriptional regulator PhoB
VKTKPVLVVDDEADIAELVSYNLKKEGFSVDTASDGETALLKLKKSSYSLVVLDLMLPGLQGVELCRIIRKDPNISSLPIIMLTAKGEEVDRILGLEIGADDYITKPFSPRELVARIRAVLRRATEKTVEDKVVRIGNLLVNKETYSVSKDSQPLALSSTEFRLLVYLAERRGKVFSRDQLLDAVWKNEAFVEPRTVDVHIRRLRAQIEDDASHPEYIKTKRGIGYYMDADL